MHTLVKLCPVSQRTPPMSRIEQARRSSPAATVAGRGPVRVVRLLRALVLFVPVCGLFGAFVATVLWADFWFGVTSGVGVGVFWSLFMATSRSPWADAFFGPEGPDQEEAAVGI